LYNPFNPSSNGLNISATLTRLALLVVNSNNKMEIVKTGIIRKEVHLDRDTKKALSSMALNNDQSLKPFIEAQLIAMGARGISYLDLWQQCEAMTAQLKSLSK
jgi:hypothetical protein